MPLIFVFALALLFFFLLSGKRYEGDRRLWVNFVIVCISWAYQARRLR